MLEAKCLLLQMQPSAVISSPFEINIVSSPFEINVGMLLVLFSPSLHPLQLHILVPERCHFLVLMNSLCLHLI